MTATFTNEQVLSRPVTNELRDDDAAWDSWDAEHESPVVNGSQLVDALKRPTVPQRPRKAKPTPDPTNAAPALETLAGQLSATPAPAVGVIGVDLSQSAASVTVAVQAFAGTGLYASRRAGGRDEQRAAVVTVDREPNGRYVATVERPGHPHLRPEECTPRSDDEALAWFEAVVLTASDAAGLPVLAVATDACFTLDRLESVARNASCLGLWCRTVPALCSRYGSRTYLTRCPSRRLRRCQRHASPHPSVRRRRARWVGCRARA